MGKLLGSKLAHVVMGGKRVYGKQMIDVGLMEE